MPHLRHFLKSARAISSVEFALIVPVFFLFILGTIDMSRAFWTWNKAETATQYGVRTAVVSALVPGAVYTYDGTADAGGAGLTVPVSTFNGGAPIRCTATGTAVNCSSYTGDQARAQAAFNTILTAMQRAYPELQPDQVELIYQHIGLGFAGNPIGPDVALNVTVRLRNVTLPLLSLGMIGLTTWPMPDFAATLTGESFGCGGGAEWDETNGGCPYTY